MKSKQRGATPIRPEFTDWQRRTMISPRDLPSSIVKLKEHAESTFAEPRRPDVSQSKLRTFWDGCGILILITRAWSNDLPMYFRHKRIAVCNLRRSHFFGAHDVYQDPALYCEIRQPS